MTIMKPLTGEYLFQSTPNSLEAAKGLIYELRKIALVQHELIKATRALEAFGDQPEAGEQPSILQPT